MERKTITVTKENLNEILEWAECNDWEVETIELHLVEKV